MITNYNERHKICVSDEMLETTEMLMMLEDVGLGTLQPQQFSRWHKRNILGTKLSQTNISL